MPSPAPPRAPRRLREVLWRRARARLPLWGIAAAALAFGAPLTRLQARWRGVVLAVAPGRALVARVAAPPRWQKTHGAVAPGCILDKAAGQWWPRPQPPLGRDLPLMQLQARYAAAYTGTVVRIEAPRAAGQPKVAVVARDGDSRLRVPLGTPALAAVTAGARLHKRAGCWDAVPVARTDAERRGPATAEVAGRATAGQGTEAAADGP